MSVLLKPLVTEKVSAMNESGTYGFKVSKDANKIQIKNEVEKTYGVSVEKVRTMVYRGKAKSRYSKTRVIKGKSSSFKKALITVAEGEVIDFYSNI